MDRPLGELLAEARRNGWASAAEVARETGCGDQCRTCRPYIARMLATGVVPTGLDLMTLDEMERYAD